MQNRHWIAGLSLAALLIAAGAARAAEPTPLKIGWFGFYSGAAASGGQEMDAAIKVYMQQHGDVVAGRKIVLLRRDTQGQANIVRQQAAELVSRDKVEILAGLQLTPEALAAATVSTPARVPVLIVNAATTSILDHAPYMARFGFTTGQAVAPFGTWAAKHGYKTVYAIYTDYGPGLEAGRVFKKTYTEAGGTIVGEVKPPFTTPDYSPYVQRAKDAHPRAIFIFAPAAGHPVAFLKAYQDAGLDEQHVQVLATGDLTDENQLAQLGDAALGMITVFDYSEAHDSAINHAFVKAFLKVAPAGIRPDFAGAATYDVINAIYTLVAAQHGKLDPDKTMAILKGMKFESPRGPIAIDQHRDIVQNIYIRKVQKVDGKLQNVEFDTIPMVNDLGEQVK
ncbi:MAG TPA: ABC transporter substrate-binding protein [Stellaceae bacterium]|jgi:branched-chain amino acid transport system substrate-binding protein|nr:ABC transporter substrate-binding protein [Stellaceae bacterium]